MYLSTRRWLRVAAVVLLSLAYLGTAVAGSTTHTHHVRHRHHRQHRRSTAPLYHAALLEDADTGHILFAENPDLTWPPASMAKMMLLLVTEDQIHAGRLSLNSPVTISARVAATGGSRLGLHEGRVYPLGELIKAALIRSANDAAVAIAEKVGGGSVERCVTLMNARARGLGMTGTLYQTVDGLPPTPGHDVDVTTPRDLATLARALIHQTDLLEWSGMETASFDDGQAVLRNTNHLIGHFEGCDGLKTGFTMEAGFNLTATAHREGMRLVSVILGAPSNAERFIQSAKLLSWGFDNFAKVQVLRRGQPLPVHVQVEQGPSIQPVSESDLALVMRKDDISGVKLQYKVPATVSGPVVLGSPMGQVIVMDDGDVMSRVEAVSPVSVGPPPHNFTPAAVALPPGSANISVSADSTQEQR